MRRNWLLIALIIGVQLLCASGIRAAASGLSAFDEAWAKIQDYTVSLKVHEALGSQTQDRTYDYWFLKPHYAKTAITSGDGRGGGGVWVGGDQVSGHQGGVISFIHLKVDLHDRRATSLRGYTLPDGLFPNTVERYRTIKGTLSERNGPVVNGEATDEVELKIANPTNDVTRMLLYLSKTTHMPVRQLRYAGDKVVTDETWSNFHPNVGLKVSDFPF
jgi:outer membrane lipoprotein-sorting protein